MLKGGFRRKCLLKETEHNVTGTVIQCPTVDEPLPDPTDPPATLPSVGTSCSYIFETTNNPVDSEESCQATCESCGIFCNPYENVTLCGTSFYSEIDCRGHPLVECICGSSYGKLGDTITLCKTETPKPPTCEDLLDGLGQDPIIDAESCLSACLYFDVDCREDADGTSTCGSRCGPKGQQCTEICGSPCGSSGAAAAIRLPLARVYSVAAAIFSPKEMKSW